MKRLLLVFITSSALVLLTGCGKISELTDFEFSLDSIVSMFNSDETDEANKTDETTQDDESDDQAGNGQSADETDSNSTNEQINISDKSAENLYKQAIKIANEYESSQVDLKADQHLTFDGEVLESQSEYTILTSSNPNVTHQKGTTRLGGDQGQDIGIEMYITDDNMYYYFDMIGSWIDLKGPLTGMLGDIIEPEEHHDSYTQLQLFENHIEHFDVKETGDTYVIFLSIDGDIDDIYKDIFEGTTDQSIEDFLGANHVDLSTDSEIDKVHYEIVLNKQNLHLKSFDMHMTINLEENGKKGKLDQTIETTYSRINEVGPIEIPEEVTDSLGFDFDFDFNFEDFELPF